MPTITETTDAPESLATPYSATFGDVFEGEIETSRERDWVRFTLDGGYGYTFNFGGDGATTSLPDTNIAIRNALGEFDFGLNADGSILSGFTVSEDAVYFFDLGSRYGSQTGTYRLSVEQEIAGNISTVETLEVGEVLQSTLDYNRDRDWIQMELEGGYGYVFSYRGDGSASS
ncbi:hypothetical protein, partial [Cognatishimia sp. F0-27]|uniref:hypothetical protein n=1 Tax=Cognatishimia sp. F0-27 TaxID=2816855 RepID=UPI001D9FA755|nr:hypothetical protein [Cognatishimia sp. F0-27]